MTSFAIYRLPMRSECVFIRRSDGGCRIVRSIGDIAGCKGFVIAPFSCDEDHPVAMLDGDMSVWPTQSDIPEDVRNQIDLYVSAVSAKYVPEELADCYADDFARFNAELQARRVDKVVLSRSENIAIDCRTSAFDMFALACRQFPRCYVALFCTPSTGAWLVSSPEVLVECEMGRAHTMALAGTMPLAEYESGRRWSDKDRREQLYVSEYIRHNLAEFADDVQVQGPDTVGAANLAHLRTDFRFDLNSCDCHRLVQSLHPTPAVCGVPTDAARGVIERYEHCRRDYYCGFSGMFDGDVDTHLFVTLRCMRFGCGVVTLYAGGGLVVGSEMHAERAETEHKMQPMKSIVNHVQR